MIWGKHPPKRNYPAGRTRVVAYLVVGVVYLLLVMAIVDVINTVQIWRSWP